MAGAAGFSRLHLGHRNSLVFCRGKVELDVTIAALKHSRMQLVAKFDVPRILYLEFHFPSGMALETIIYLKRVFTVMASAA